MRIIDSRLWLLVAGVALVGHTAFAQAPSPTPNERAPKPIVPGENLSKKLKQTNGVIHPKEVDPAIEKPARTMFVVVDLNHDGKITPEEAQRARRAVISQIRMFAMPEAPNSPRNLIRSRGQAANASPIPNINPNNRPAPGTQPATPTTPPNQP